MADNVCKNCGVERAGENQICRECGEVRTYYQPSNTLGLDHDDWNTQIVGLMGARPGALGDRVLPDMHALIGVSADRYEVLKTLGMGAVGMVYLARDHQSSELVALKVLRPALMRNAEIVARFSREIEIARKLRHPNIARVDTLVRTEVSVFIVMQYIEGVDLGEYQRTRQLTLDQKLAIMKQVCAAVDHAHSMGVIHRDLKPNNIMIDKDGRPFVLDFGIATMEDQADITRLGSFMGTPLYMSPEQAQGKRLDHRSDIYALGVIFYELVAGRPPFIGESAITIALKHIREMPFSPRSLNPAIPPLVENVIMRCLDKEARGRPETALDIIRAIEEPIEREIAEAKSAALSGASKEPHSGEIRDISLFQYLRVMVPVKRNFILEIVNNDEYGRYHFRDAQLVHGEARNLLDEEVAYNLFYWTRGTYRVISDPEPPPEETVRIAWMPFVDRYFASLKRAFLGVHGVVEGPVIVELLDLRNASLFRYASDLGFEASVGDLASISTDKFQRARQHFKQHSVQRVARSTAQGAVLFAFLSGLRHYFYIVAEPRNDLERAYQWLRSELEQEMIEALHDGLVASDARRQGRGRTRKVLVAENEDFLGNLMRIKLRAMGMEVYLVRDGSRAVEVAAQFRPDVVVLNINIPSISGPDICRILASDPMLRHTPILLLTPYERQGELDMPGVVRVLHKPIVLSELSDLVWQQAARARV